MHKCTHPEHLAYCLFKGRFVCSVQLLKNQRGYLQLYRTQESKGRRMASQRVIIQCGPRNFWSKALL